MRSRQCLLEICGTLVDENFGVWKTRRWPEPLCSLQIAFGAAAGLLRYRMPKLRHEREAARRSRRDARDVELDAAGSQSVPPTRPADARTSHALYALNSLSVYRTGTGPIGQRSASVRYRASRRRQSQSSHQARVVPRSQVPGILNARIHALRTDGAVDARRIAGEEMFPWRSSRLATGWRRKRVSHAGFAEAKGFPAPGPGGSTESLSSDSGRSLDDRRWRTSLRRTLIAPRPSRWARDVVGRPSGEEHGDFIVVGKRSPSRSVRADHRPRRRQRANARDSCRLRMRRCLRSSDDAMGTVAPNQEPRVKVFLPTIHSAGSDHRRPSPSSSNDTSVVRRSNHMLDARRCSFRTSSVSAGEKTNRT